MNFIFSSQVQLIIIVRRLQQSYSNDRISEQALKKIIKKLTIITTITGIKIWNCFFFKFDYGNKIENYNTIVK